MRLVGGVLSAVLALTVIGCSSTSKKALQLSPGMSVEEIIETVGMPAERTFRGSDEAWQYREVVGFGQCRYMTAWIRDGKLAAVTTRRGGSIAGCGLGSSEVDWGQMPNPSIDVNIGVPNQGCDDSPFSTSNSDPC